MQSLRTANAAVDAVADGSGNQNLVTLHTVNLQRAMLDEAGALFRQLERRPVWSEVGHRFVIEWIRAGLSG